MDATTRATLPSWARRRVLTRPGIASTVAALLVVYVALYLGWLAFRWGGPGLELAIADGVFIPLGLAGSAFALLAARRARTRSERRAWLLITASLLAFCAGDILWFWLEVVVGDSPYPSIADAFYLAFYPLMLLGLLALPRERPENRVRSLLDIAIVVVGASTVVWWLVLEPVARGTSSDSLTTLVALAYPVGDLLVVFALAATLMGRLLDTSRRALVLLGIGLALNVVADLAYARLALQETYVSGQWMDVCYVAAWTLIALGSFTQARSWAVARMTSAQSAPIRPVSFPPYVAVGGVYGVLLIATEIASSSMRVVVLGAIAVTGLVIVRQVITSRENARLLADRASSDSAARFRAIIQNANDVIALVDADGTIDYVTPSAVRLTGRSAESLHGTGLAGLLDPEDAPLALELLRTDATRAGTGDTIQCRIQTPAGDLAYAEMNVTNLLDDPVVAGLVVTFRDVSERRQFEEQLRDQAFHDPLTGLANRALLADRIDRTLLQRQGRVNAPGLLYLDLDNFKTINDTLGHAVGDQLLVEVANRIKDTVRAEDTVARLGGDEFAILIDQATSMDEVVAAAERILAALRSPIHVGGTVVTIGASIGVVRPEGRDPLPANVLRDADIAMYEAKREARGSYRVFELAMFAATVERVSLDTDLRAGMAGGQFELVYQPLFSLADGLLSGVEALLRWNHPTRGLVMPLTFIPVAERNGEIVPIGRWVIEQACRTVGGWNALDGVRHLRANVNVSARQLKPRFVEDVTDILQRTKFPPGLLVLEITESVFAAERPGTLEILHSLRSLGVHISIDDFGTGYSSLSVLRDLPVDELKIDRSFIEALQNHGDTSVIDAIIKLSHDFRLTTVAEGIEFEDQAALLRALGCDVGQGFQLGRPGSAVAIEDIIRAELGSSADTLLRSA